MFIRGYDSWHFLTMSTSVATVEAILRAYFALRQHSDEAYRADTEAEAARAVHGRASIPVPGPRSSRTCRGPSASRGRMAC